MGVCSIVLFNFGPDAFRATKGDRIAQIIFEKVSSAPIVSGVVHDHWRRSLSWYGSLLARWWKKHRFIDDVICPRYFIRCLSHQGSGGLWSVGGDSINVIAFWTSLQADSKHGPQLRSSCSYSIAISWKNFKGAREFSKNELVINLSAGSILKKTILSSLAQWCCQSKFQGQ